MMNVWQKTLFTYVSIYVLALPMHLPEGYVIKISLLTAGAIFYGEGGLDEIRDWLKNVFCFFKEVRGTKKR